MLGLLVLLVITLHASEAIAASCWIRFLSVYSFHFELFFLFTAPLTSAASLLFGLITTALNDNTRVNLLSSSSRLASFR